MTRTLPEMEIMTNDDGWWESVLSDEENISLSAGDFFLEDGEISGIKNNWDKAVSIYKNDEIIYLNVKDHNRGGLLVEGEGITGFVPLSHLLDFPASLEGKMTDDIFSSFEGRKLKLKIIECNPEEGRIIFSERAATSEAGKRLEIFKSIQAGQKIDGVVTNITKFGVFVDLGGVEGLVHISEISWGRVIHPNQICRLGQHLKVLVMEVSPEKSRIALSMKRLSSNPWDMIKEKYSENQIVSARITGLVPYGAFARLEEGIEGLIHVSEMPLENDEKVDHLLEIDQIVNVKVLLIDPTRHKISLSLKP